MSRWIRKTPVPVLQALPVRVVRTADADHHQCVPPAEVDAGPRSVWECDCGQRWRIAIPYWRPLGEAETHPVELPGWVRLLTPNDSD